MTDAQRFSDIKATVNEGLACLIPSREIAWLVLRVEQLEREVQNLRDALASS